MSSPSFEIDLDSNNDHSIPISDYRPSQRIKSKDELKNNSEK